MSKKKKDAQQAAAEENAPESPVVEPEAETSEAEEPAVDEAPGPESEPEPEPELTAEEQLARERDEFKEKWLRVLAELDNVRKRSSRQLLEGRKFAQADVLRAFLEVQDNFERALQSMTGAEDTDSHKSLREGVELIFQSYRRVLKDQGVEPIEALEKEFDPAVHEAVGQFERDGAEPGQVIEVVQQGFKLGDLVLRPARVIISS